jgi:hypothetical protein
MYIVQRWENEDRAEYQKCCIFDTLDEAHSFILSQKYNHPYRVLYGGVVVFSERPGGYDVRNLFQ